MMRDVQIIMNHTDARTEGFAGHSPPEAIPSGNRILLVVNEGVLGVKDVPANVLGMIEAEGASIFVTVPALNSRLRSVVSDSDDAVLRAHERLLAVLEVLRSLGIEAHGEVGDEDPFLAIDDVLRERPIDRIVILLHEARDQNWLEKNLAHRVVQQFGVPAAELVIDRGLNARAWHEDP
jgi:hypothetical protein